MFCCHIEGTL